MKEEVIKLWRKKKELQANGCYNICKCPRTGAKVEISVDVYTTTCDSIVLLFTL